MTALTAKANISGSPSRATANAGFGEIHDFLNERFAAGTATAAEKAATRAALEAARGLQPITASVGSNALTITLNPTNLDFRSATLGSGDVVTRNVASAISVVVSSGSTLGTSNGVAARLIVLAIDNAGTVELAVVNAYGTFHLDESQLISTTAEGGAGAADSASTVYSTTARSNVAFRVVGYIECTQTTAGTWATAPSKIQGAGGLTPRLMASLINQSPTITASGQTSMDFAVPSWARRIKGKVESLQRSSNSQVLVRIGDPGGPENAGYKGGGTEVTTTATTPSLETTGFRISTNGPGNTVDFNGEFTIEIQDESANRWTYNGSFHRSTPSTGQYTGTGSKALSAILDRVQITMADGTSTFTAGSVSISWE